MLDENRNSHAKCIISMLLLIARRVVTNIKLQANSELDTRCGSTFQEICLDDLYLHNVKVGYDTKRYWY